MFQKIVIIILSILQLSLQRKRNHQKIRLMLDNYSEHYLLQLVRSNGLAQVSTSAWVVLKGGVNLLFNQRSDNLRLPRRQSWEGRSCLGYDNKPNQQTKGARD